MFAAIAFLMIALFIGGIAHLTKSQRGKNDAILAELSGKNGWTIVDPPKLQVPSLTDGPNKPSGPAGRTLYGQLSGLPFWFYYNSAMQGVNYFEAMVLTLQLPRPLPTMVLDSVANDVLMVSTLLNPPSRRGLQRLALEGEFQGYFELFVEPNQQIDALSIITPELMSKMINTGALFDIDFDGQYVHIINTTKPYWGSDYTPKMAEVAAVLADSLALKMRTYGGAAAVAAAPATTS